MATPTDQQQIRATLRRHARATDEPSAVELALTCAAEIGSPDEVMATALRLWPDTLMGASEAADALVMKATNLKRLSPPLVARSVVSGRIPVYIRGDVLAAKARRDARRAT
jgi:hypothetical protein